MEHIYGASNKFLNRRKKMKILDDIGKKLPVLTY